MIGAKRTEAACQQCELEIAIDATREQVWDSLFNDTGSWWLPDFHVVGPDSTVTFDASPGGRGLLEVAPNGDALLWYSVQLYLPSEFKIYLIGHIAPEWGGPTTSSLQLAVVESGTGCIFQVTDARHGRVEENQVQSYEDGWRQLFSDGLRKHVESNAS